MISVKLVLALAVFAVDLQEILGHGKLMRPIARASRWRDDRFNESEPHYEDNQLYCGGIGVYTSNGYKCGVCGDPYNQPSPRENENTGKYGNGIIVETYRKGQQIKANVSLDTNHKGYFKFALCPLSKKQPIETEECFKKYPLKLTNGSRLRPIKRWEQGFILIDLNLPKNLTCEHCSFRWHYRSGNNWHPCRDGAGRTGCSLNHEVFRGCADIRII
ncbi:hypothetical protein QAD02_000365 [Eretmocerus hayati]|uniref:Uncharacterized protein n=1 Tax=Eretmocerus hayati TaxID=131215 RepID=A0ACC2NDY1_9HYME|nr:hypothetical protein QAD02_000365 [Eretmocerus hayati]